MKKVFFTFFIILFLPLNILAYSKYIIPGGESIGININSDGLIVVGYYKVNGNFIARKNINIGDRIIKINNKNVSSIKELTKEISNNIKDNDEVDIIVKRNNRIVNTKLVLKEENNVLKTGLYIKDNVVGLGTLTYIDPVTNIYGALGHDIILNETKNRVEIKDGNILLSKVTSIDKSRNGKVGSKNAYILFKEKIGTIEKNIDSGIYGFYTGSIPKKDTMEVADFSHINKGNAYILTVTNNNEIKKYNILIIDKYYSKRNTNKAFSFEIIDDNLINKTGGIVQGMSGSPIIQDNKIIGCITNVVIDNVLRGYAISIVKMLEDGDKIRN